MPASRTAGGKQTALEEGAQTVGKKLFSPEGGRIVVPANERIAEFLDFVIRAKFDYVNKLRARDARPYNAAEKATAHHTAMPVGARIARPRFVQKILIIAG